MCPAQLAPLVTCAGRRGNPSDAYGPTRGAGGAERRRLEERAWTCDCACNGPPARSAAQTSAVPVPAPTETIVELLPLKRPQLDVTFALCHRAFTKTQLAAIPALLPIPSGKSYFNAGNGLHCPPPPFFFVIEFKAQAKRGTMYVAANQAAGAGAVALNNTLQLWTRSLSSYADAVRFDYNELLFIPYHDRRQYCVHQPRVGRAIGSTRFISSA
jgi:hypothetical protein